MSVPDRNPGTALKGGMSESEVDSPRWFFVIPNKSEQSVNLFLGLMIDEQTQQVQTMTKTDERGRKYYYERREESK